MSDNCLNIIAEDKIYPIIRNKNPKKTIEIALALIEGGIRVLEINVESPEIYDSIKEISKHATVCAGGIITSTQADWALHNGAKLFASPIFQMNMVKISKNLRIPFIAGTTTANEAYSAWKSRIQLIKIFPAEAMGGIHYIEGILRQMPFLNLMPTGNIKLKEVPLSILDDYHRTYQEIELIVSSLRIDTVVSRLIGSSRDNIKKKFYNDEVILNYEVCNKNSYLLNDGDIFSIRKYRKYKFNQILKNTKKGGFIIEILMYK